MTPRPHVAANRPERGCPLEDDLPEEEDEHPRDVEAVREERPVARVGTLLGLDPAHGEDHRVRLAGEEVASARPTGEQQPLVGRVTALELCAVGRSRARHHGLRLLLDPAERGDVLVGAEQDARLARAGLRREVRLPAGELVALLGRPPCHVRRVAVSHRPAENGQREAVDLQEEDARRVRLDGVACLAGDPLDDPVRPLAVVVDTGQDLEDESHCGGDERDEQRRPEAVDVQVAVGQVVRREQHQRVEDEDEDEAED